MVRLVLQGQLGAKLLPVAIRKTKLDITDKTSVACRVFHILVAISKTGEIEPQPKDS